MPPSSAVSVATHSFAHCPSCSLTGFSMSEYVFYFPLSELSENHSQTDQPLDVVESDEAAEVAATTADCGQQNVSLVSGGDEEATMEASSSGTPGDHLAQPSQLSVFYVPRPPSAAEIMTGGMPFAPDDRSSSLSMASGEGMAAFFFLVMVL